MSSAAQTDEGLTEPDGIPRPQNPGGTAASAGPTYYAKSAYLAGRVAVGIITPESVGPNSREDWGEGEKDKYIDKVRVAMDWWAQREPRAHLSFVFDTSGKDITTTFEPTDYASAREEEWATDVMTNMKYEGVSHLSQIEAYLDFLRQTYNTDWATCIFIVHGSSFSNGRSGFAYIGGPAAFITTDGGAVDPLSTLATITHEFGHLFGALDQYPTTLGCNAKGGYFGVLNRNSQANRDVGDCDPNDQPSIMRGDIVPAYVAGALDKYARGQVGWLETDNGFSLDSTLQWGLDSPDCAGITRGSIADIPKPPATGVTIDINGITSVEYRVFGENWVTAQPDDGKFDGTLETFTIDLTPGKTRAQTAGQTLSVRAMNTRGQTTTMTLCGPPPKEFFLPLATH